MDFRPIFDIDFDLTTATRLPSAEETGRHLTALIWRDAVEISLGRVPLIGELALAAARLEARLRRLVQDLRDEAATAQAEAIDGYVRGYWPIETILDLPVPIRAEMDDLVHGSQDRGTSRPSLLGRVLETFWGADPALASVSDRFEESVRAWARGNLLEVRRRRERLVVDGGTLPAYVADRLRFAIAHPELGRTAHMEAQEMVRAMEEIVASSFSHDTYIVQVNGRDRRDLFYRALVNCHGPENQLGACETMDEHRVRKGFDPRRYGSTDVDAAGRRTDVIVNNAVRESHLGFFESGFFALVRLLDEAGIDAAAEEEHASRNSSRVMIYRAAEAAIRAYRDARSKDNIPSAETPA